MKAKVKTRRPGKYPPYPGSGWDYGVRMAAAQKLLPPNKLICVYCHGQCPAGAAVPHQPDCPARNDK